jgi:uncharacterized protein (DUF305 family)
MKRVTLKIRFWGLVAVLVTAASGAITACAQNQTTSPQSSPAATDANNKPMDHSGMSGMDHNMGMNLGSADAEFDLRFIDAMTPHHQGAVEMAKEAKQKSKRPEIQKLANDIIKSQDQEIAQMKQWRQAWYPTASAEPIAYNTQMGHSMPMTQDQKSSMMMSMDLGAADANFDLRFINAMIPHHQGAVTMAQDALTKSKRPEIQKLANDIIASQKAEISQMEQWRKAWYNQ